MLKKIKIYFLSSEQISPRQELSLNFIFLDIQIEKTIHLSTFGNITYSTCVCEIYDLFNLYKSTLHDSQV